MKRFTIFVLAFMLLFSGCSSSPRTDVQEESAAVVPAVADTVSESEEADDSIQRFGSPDVGFCLTYPKTFHLSSSEDNFYEFKNQENDLSITLSIEENPYSGMPAEEYPQAMDLDMYSTMLSDNSFSRDVYAKNDTSSYSIYSMTDDFIYCVEYTYNGQEGQDEVIDMLDFETYGQFSGADAPEMLRSYAQVYLNDLTGGDTEFELTDGGTVVIDDSEMSVFHVIVSDKPVCWIAVNSSGVCYVDYSCSGEKFINIELLLYDTGDTGERYLYYAMYYYEKLFGITAEKEFFTPCDLEIIIDDQQLNVFSVSDSAGNNCLIGVTDNGIGYSDSANADSRFEIIPF